MPDIAQQVSEFLARRQAIVAQTVAKGGQQAEALLKSYGAPSSLDAIIAGGQQGVMHGFADDWERSQSPDGVARNQIMAKAARPVEYEVSALLGTMAASMGLRGATSLLGRGASATARAGAKASTGAGGAAIAARQAKRAKEIESKFNGLGMKPQTRGMVLDAGHGAAWGYGGADVSQDEEGFSMERAGRAAMGAAVAPVGAAIATSGGVAAANIPLAFGGRRIGSERMLEPPGVVTKAQAFWDKILRRPNQRAANPKGYPRDAIEIARSQDETLARGPVDPFTGKPVNPGIIARDTAPPMQSAAPRVQRLADQALAPVAPQRINDLRGQQRQMAGDAIEAQYRAPARVQQPQPPLQIAKTPGASDLARERAARGERPDPIADMREAQLMRDEARRDAIYNRQQAARAPQQPDPTDTFVGQMMEAFVRQDRPALESWLSTLEAAARKNPAIMPAIKASVAKQVAINERANPDLNNTPVMREFLNALGLWGNKAKGTSNILEAARAPAREKFPTDRYEEALARTKGETPMRARHADNLRTEMDAYEPGPYTGPVDRRRGQPEPLVERGDDQPYWLNPVDFLKEGKVNDAQVNVAGLLSGPIAYEAENLGIGPLMHWAVGSPDHVNMPQEPQKAGMLADITPETAPMPEEEDPIPAPAPVRQAAQPAAPRQQAQPQRAEKDVIMDIQAAMIEAGIPVGGRDGQPDGVIGPKTARAIELFTMGSTHDLEAVLRRIRNYPRERLAQILR